MPKAFKIAVITGDIIGSGGFRNTRHKDKLLNLMKESLKQVKKSEKPGIIQPAFEIYRGDSFQGVVTDIKRSLVVGLKIKALLQMGSVEFKKIRLDARISIGIGKSGAMAKRINESDGEAFQLSGKNLDRMKAEEQGIYLSTYDDKSKNHIELLSTLLDLITSKWSIQQAEVIYLWLNGATQSEIANRLRLSQPSVNQRLQAGNKNRIEKGLEYFEWLSDSI